MNVFDVKTNKRIIDGNFSDVTLYPAKIADFTSDDIEQLAEKGFKAIKECPELLTMLLSVCKNRYVEMQNTAVPDLYKNEVNVLINTGFDPNILMLNFTNKIFSSACDLIPVITELDKVLWTGISLYYFSRSYDSNYFTEEHNSMLYVLVSLLLSIEDQERRTGKTISIDTFIKLGANISEIQKMWDNMGKDALISLTAREKNAFESLYIHRSQLKQEIDEKINTAKTIALNTSFEWEMFIRILNDMSLKEADIIRTILQPLSPKEKISAIYQYQSDLSNIERGQCCIDGETIKLIPILDKVIDRIQNASCYATVFTDREEPFALFPTAFNLVISPKTYNYLLVLFHLFRMKQNKETAKEFLALALELLKNNLGISSETECFSINGIIEDFHSTVFKFYNQNKEAINRLSFSRLKNDSAVVTAALAGADSYNMYTEDVFSRVHNYENSKEYSQKLEDVFLKRDIPLSSDQFLQKLASEEKIAELKEEEIQATQLIKSLNIIYMFCESMRLILNNKQISSKIKDLDIFNRYRRELLNLEDKLVHKVYEDLDDHEIGMLEYREKIGILSGVLSEQEIQEERLRNELFSQTLKSIIDDITIDIEKQDTNKLIDIKRQIREEVLRFPDCDEKDQYAEWLDDVSDRINNALISNCKTSNYYECTQELIVQKVGTLSHILPKSTLDSLTTAEMLYNSYATMEFSNKGFDFSCISALYYQAFEEAYNKLIWRKYADFLNNLMFDDGKSFTSILEHSRGISINNPSAIGYLDDDARQRDYYIEYKSKRKQRFKTVVSERCMYTSFAILLKNIEPSSKMDKFCDFFANLAGYKDKGDMFSDSEYMCILSEFCQKVSDSADDRNNASHGGTYISLEQCSKDKKAVLSELEALRSESLGLIQLLTKVIKS